MVDLTRFLFSRNVDENIAILGDARRTLKESKQKSEANALLERFNGVAIKRKDSGEEILPPDEFVWLGEIPGEVRKNSGS